MTVGPSFEQVASVEDESLPSRGTVYLIHRVPHTPTGPFGPLEHCPSRLYASNRASLSLVRGYQAMR